MNAYFLHLESPERGGAPAIIAGDTEALRRLRDAVDDALAGGAGAARFYSSDGEAYDLLLIREQDMGSAYTAYKNESSPQRSLRESRPLNRLDNYTRATRQLRHRGDEAASQRDQQAKRSAVSANNAHCTSDHALG
jgi:hypothetical protein